MENKNKFFENRKIFPSITTISSNWRKKIEEVRKLGLKEVCLFLTCLEKNEREELYKLLEKTKIEKIPLVHLRSDMNLKELDYLVNNYKTEVFNTHTERKYPFLYNLDKYKNIIYMENASLPLDEEEIKNFAGVCLDISHLEISRILNRERYKNDIEILKKYPLGCNHISAVKKIPVKKKDKLEYDFHYLEDLSDLDYLKRYPAKYFSSILAIELENPIKEQLKAKDYIIDLLKNK